MTVNDVQIEEYAKAHLLASGIVAELKKAQVFIWTIRAKQNGLFIAIDSSKNPVADCQRIEAIIQDFLAPLDLPVEVQRVPMAGNCCYGVCHGCLNGCPELQKTWIL